MRIAVAGGTGMAGKHVVEAVRAAGHEPQVLSRSAGVDLVTGRGLAAAMDGVSRVIDASNVTTTNKGKAVAFFEAATGNLLRAEARAGVAHHVVLSIVGIDRIGFGYYQGKLRQEELVRTGGVPFTVLRTTQFHEFAAQMLARGGLIALAPRMRCRPVAVREAADMLVRLALADPAGYAPELAGPQVLDMADMVKQLHRARGGHRPVLAMRLPGPAGRAMAEGGLLPLEEGPRGTETFDEWVRNG